jgi:predicted nucleic acid-binding protein
MNTVLIDTNVLLLHIIGEADPKIIGKHKSVANIFDARAFHTLQAYLLGFQKIDTLPWILAETSNLLRQHRDPEKQKLIETFERFVALSTESVFPSAKASVDPSHRRLGLIDAAILCSAKRQTTILTTDLDLFLEATRRKITAVNFTHLLPR